MDWFSGVIVFILTWWVVIFCVLPFGLQRDQTGKPEKVFIARTVFFTTLITSVLWFALYLLIDSDLISFRQMAAAQSGKELNKESTLQ